ncbi:MAG: T9SS type A sorting domain-containing protein [Burkholderiales bacterium]|nr:T9SS type A sorting domain-containing protein [Bacteroidia bacterium]
MISVLFKECNLYNGCVAAATAGIRFGKSLIQLQLSECRLILFPNPSKGILTISNTIVKNKLDVSTTNTVGQTIMEESAENTNVMSINLCKYSKGVYYVRGTTSQNITIQVYP